MLQANGDQSGEFLSGFWDLKGGLIWILNRVELEQLLINNHYNIKDEVLVISGIIKVEVIGIISRAKGWGWSLTETLIILDINNLI